jgi:3-hydroxyisobutyrate dehydrogenase-like beta-hydroxyacid dehydrogenase
MQKVGFIGLGLMGGPMAANVARAGYPLTVYNRTPDKAEPLRELGAAVAVSPFEVARHSEVIVTMLADGRAVEAVLLGEDGVLAGAQAGTVVIDMSTIAPDETRCLAALLDERGLKMLDAPVYGSVGPARDGTLGIMVGGEQAVFEAQRDLLSVMGKALFYMGPSGSGTMVKLCINLMVAAEMMALAEAMMLAASGGLDLAQVGQVITSSAISSKMIENKVGNITHASFAAAFPLKHMHKDLGLMVQTAAALGAPLPVTGLTHQLYTAARETGHAEEDFSAIYRLLSGLAGREG